MKVAQFLKRIGSDDRGATAIEYGLIASLVVVACIASFQSVADSNTGLWATITDKVLAVW
jgi:pilus assembly protein Flp/PilA